MGVGARHDFVADVGPVEAGNEHLGRFQMQLGDDFAPGQLVCGGGEGDARHRREIGGQKTEFAIFRAKVVAPLRDAVGFVDGEQGDLGARQQIARALAQQTLGRDVEQIEFPRQELALNPRGAGSVETGVQKCGLYPRFIEGRYLISHQGDQRRDDDAAASAQHGGNLEAQGFAAARRHEHQTITTGGNALNDGLLRTAKSGIAEYAAEEFERGRHAARE